MSIRCDVSIELSENLASLLINLPRDRNRRTKQPTSKDKWWRHSLPIPGTKPYAIVSRSGRVCGSGQRERVTVYVEQGVVGRAGCSVAGGVPAAQSRWLRGAQSGCVTGPVFVGPSAGHPSI